MPDGAHHQHSDQPANAVSAKSGRPRLMSKPGRPVRAPRRLSELDRAERGWAVLRTVIILIVFWCGLIAVYYATPAGRTNAADAFPRLAVGLLVFAAVLAWQNSRIGRVELPELLAARALGSAIPLFLTVFATIYLTLSHTSAADFSQRLNHTRALYFTITVFSTVGFGDITPATDAARLMVSIQMLLDLVIIALVVRLLLNAAKTSLVRADQASPSLPET
jgi:voltage-gated potassium channel